MMPAVPGMVSRMIAAMVEGPSKATSCSRYSRARADSSSGVVLWKGER
jgi:hypothetical protein